MRFLSFGFALSLSTLAFSKTFSKRPNLLRRQIQETQIALRELQTVRNSTVALFFITDYHVDVSMFNYQVNLSYPISVT